MRPARYSRRKCANTRSRYSAAKLTASSSMPITSATAAASIRSSRDVQWSSVSSSSQFFMNTPTTSWPSRLSSSAATDESTPPDSPTTMRSRFTGRPSQQPGTGADDVLHEVERPAPPCAVIVDAAHHQRAAVLVAARDDLVVRKPQRLDDAFVELAPGHRGERRRRVREAHERRAVVGRFPAVDADERRRLDLPRRLLERLARGTGRQRLARLEVAGGLVQPQTRRACARARAGTRRHARRRRRR